MIVLNKSFYEMKGRYVINYFGLVFDKSNFTLQVKIDLPTFEMLNFSREEEILAENFEKELSFIEKYIYEIFEREFIGKPFYDSLLNINGEVFILKAIEKMNQDLILTGDWVINMIVPNGEEI